MLQESLNLGKYKKCTMLIMGEREMSPLIPEVTTDTFLTNRMIGEPLMRKTRIYSCHTEFARWPIEVCLEDVSLHRLTYTFGQGQDSCFDDLSMTKRSP